METDLHDALRALGPGTGSFVKLFRSYLHQREQGTAHI